MILNLDLSPLWITARAGMTKTGRTMCRLTGRELPPVLIEVAKDKMGFIAVGFELAEFGDPYRLSSSGKVAMSLFNLGYRPQLQSEAIHRR
jgi:hypothetical protein